ncbi:MAG: hypothetical protein ACJAYU_004124 [Bradymonadia bacterium]|jgi:hypothetical protein
MNKFSLILSAAAGMLLLSPTVNALEQEFVAEVSDAEAERPDGWTHTVNLGASIQVAGSNKVPGQPDGPSVTLSLNFAYGGHLWRGHNELRLTGTLSEAISRTPLVDDFVKSTDTLAAEAIYYYHLPSAPWIGPFLRTSARTSLFAGVDVRSDDVDYLRDGEVITADRLRLTDSFSPTYLKQSVGVFARPVEDQSLTIDFRLGVGSRETFADGSYVLGDDDATPEIELTALNTFTQAGGEFATELYGASGDITYGASYEMMVPFYDSIDEDLDPIPATNYEIGANFGARLSDWASVSYELGLLRIPQIVEEWQITNQLLLNFNYGFVRGVGAE